MFAQCLKLAKSQIQKMEWCIPGAGNGANGELLFTGYRISVVQDGKSSGEQMYGDVHVHSIAKLYTKKQLKWSSFMLCSFTEIKKKNTTNKENQEQTAGEIIPVLYWSQIRGLKGHQGTGLGPSLCPNLPG